MISFVSDRRTAIGAFVAVAVAFRAACVLLLPIGTEADMAHRSGDERYFFQIAHAILEQSEFVEGNLRAYRPPLYPALLAVHLAIFGGNTAALAILQNVAFVAAIALLALIATRLYGLRVGLTCGALVLTSPAWIKLPEAAYTETLFLLLVSGALLLALDLAEHPSAARAFVCGLLLGGAALTREIGLPMGLAVIGSFALMARRREGPRAAARAAAVALLGLVLVVGPWTERNYRVFGHLVPISTNGPINLYIGNNADATGLFASTPWLKSPLWNTPTVHGENELAVARWAGQEAVSFMKEHPRRTAALAVHKLGLLWFPPPAAPRALTAESLARHARSLFYTVYTVLGFYGLFRLRSSFLGRAILALALVVSVVHALTYFDLRFRAPIDALFAIPAAFALRELGLRLLARRAAARDERDATGTQA
jgi:4-amino-4-deoxy-L-arabinose transferase-like glycosyltransferase